MQVILTPYRAPNADAYAGRSVRSVREECSDHLLIFDARHAGSHPNYIQPLL